MAHDVFISYSSEDKAIADAVCATLENIKIRCWIAPRDVPPGKLYGASLINAVKSARVLVLVLSEDTNQSEYVVRELNEAVAKGITIIPFRIEEVEPSEKLGFYINSIHWLDAMDPPLERYLNILADKVQAFLAVREEDQPPASETVVTEIAKKRKSLPLWAIVLIGLASVIVLGVVGLWVVPKLNPAPSSPTSTTVALLADPSDIPNPEPTPSPEASSPTSTTVALVAVPTEMTSLPDEGNWRPLTFMTPKPQLWEESGDNSYTTVGQHSMDAFAWSTESFEGDLTITLDLQRPESKSDGCVIVYGDGNEHSHGSLIFCVDWDGYNLVKHTVYHEGENFLAYVNHNNDTDEVYSLKIEIIDDLANMYVSEELVLSSFFDPQEINRAGRIGLHKIWYVGEIIFSNIQINTYSD